MQYILKLITCIYKLVSSSYEMKNCRDEIVNSQLLELFSNYLYRTENMAETHRPWQKKLFRVDCDKCVPSSLIEDIFARETILSHAKHSFSYREYLILS